MIIIENEPKKIKLKLYHDIRINDDRYMFIGKDGNEYRMSIKDYSGRCLNNFTITTCKRFSTLNKYAKCYGIEFYE